MKPIEFTVIGKPKGQPRARRQQYGKGVYTPSSSDDFRDAVRSTALPLRPPAPIAVPVSISLSYFLQRPKTHFKKGKLRPEAPTWAPRKPDVDNLAKLVLDVLTKLGFWLDDDQVVWLIVTKQYCDPPEVPSMIVHIKEIE